MTMTYKKRNLENINKLADNTKAAALKWHSYLEKHDIDVLIYETIRTKQTQAQYVDKGVSQTMKSYHIVGQALDWVPVVKGKTIWGGYGTADAKKAIAEAKRLGFEWGGDWKSFVDKPHLQFNYKGYGTDTFGKKVTAAKPKPTPEAVIPYPGHILTDGSRGKAVGSVQRALKIKDDEIYGPATKKAVKAYQRRMGLGPDGIVGRATWNKLF